MKEENKKRENDMTRQLIFKIYIRKNEIMKKKIIIKVEEDETKRTKNHVNAKKKGANDKNSSQLLFLNILYRFLFSSLSLSKFTFN